jgi:hypothetical protein
MTVANGQHGTYMQTAGAVNNGVDFGVFQPIKSNIFTIAVLAAPANVAGYKVPFSQRLGSGALEQIDFVFGSTGLLSADGRGVQIYYRDTSGTPYYADNNLLNGVPDGTPHWYGTTRNAAGDLSVWRDGEDITVNRTTPSGTFVSANQRTRIGNLGDYTADGSFAGSHPIGMTVVLDGIALDARTWPLLVKQAWWLFAPLPRQTMFALGFRPPILSGAGVIDITATSARPQVTLTF